MTFFVMADSPAGRELHLFDTQTGIARLLEVHTGVFNEGTDFERPKSGVPDPGSGAFAGDIFVFAAAATDVERYELYASDGTENGTRFLTAMTPDDPGRSDPEHFESFDEMALFSAHTAEAGRELWITDGTINGTRLLADIVEGTGSGVRNSYRFVDIDGVSWSKQSGGFQYFWLEDVEAGAALWRTDGTTAGTIELKGSTPSWLEASDSARRYLGLDVGNNMDATVALGDQLIFGAASGDQPNALWITDGTATSLLTDFGGDDDTEIPSNLIEVDGRVFFVTNDSNGNSRTEIWRTDGTPEGTQIFTELAEGTRAAHLTRFGDHLYFRARNADGEGDLGFELYRATLSDGTVELFADTEPGSPSGSIRNLTAVGDRLYFSVNGADYREPWVTDGTAEGTFQLANISASGGSADANDGGYGFFGSGELVYFVARSDDEGDELWMTDGTQQGTRLASALNPGSRGSDPVIFQPVAPDALDLDGTEEADELQGGPGKDTLRGYEGDDRLLGYGGNDSIDAGPGTDTINGGDGDDSLVGGPAAAEDDLRDVIFAGAGNDLADGGGGNDLIYGQEGNDTLAGGFGADELQGQGGNDVITGGALSDLVFGGAGDDFVNGGFGYDRINGGDGADRFFHLGVADHGSDWVQDYDATEGDVLVFGQAATADQFQINLAHTATPDGVRSGDASVQEAFVIYRPTGQIMWALVDGEGQESINLQIGGEVFDLLA
ncbi:hypothetical protein ACFORG_16250 [Lutimaribacter marinistellae]|uniref:ELWxxDGT repeat-containing protein n=1 Tax=Lutimaribacter marinistellae TaxID=1820329 RepID=A0ABV7TJV2_9RHOB